MSGNCSLQRQAPSLCPKVPSTGFLMGLEKEWRKQREWVKEVEGQSIEKTLADEGQNEELKNISFETSPPVAPYSLFLGLLVGFSSSSCVF